MKRMPKKKTIAGMVCLCRELAAERIGCSTSKLDRIVALSRQKKAKVRLRFYQLCKGAPIWFPEEWLDSFVNEVMEKGFSI